MNYRFSCILGSKQVNLCVIKSPNCRKNGCSVNFENSPTIPYFFLTFAIAPSFSLGLHLKMFLGNPSTPLAYKILYQTHLTWKIGKCLIIQTWVIMMHPLLQSKLFVSSSFENTLLAKFIYDDVKKKGICGGLSST